MDFKPTDEQQMLRDSAERLLGDLYDPRARALILDGEHGFSPDMWRQFADLGWLGILVPEAHGGLGWSVADTCVLMEALGGALVLEPYIPTAVIGALLISQCDDEAMKEALLPDLVNGTVMIALAHQEPGRRYDADNITTTARKSRQRWHVSGDKQLALAAPSADKLIVSARIEGEAGDLALFLVDRAATGVAIEGYSLIDGTSAADVRLTDAAAQPLMLDSERAKAVLGRVLDSVVLCATADALGAMEATLSITSDYIKTRHQFGQAIGKFQALQHRMAEMFVELQQTRSILFRGLSLVEAEPDERRRAVSFAKAFAGDAAKFIGANGIQLHGGYGMTEEFFISHLFKRLFTFQKLWGDSDWHYLRASAAPQLA